MPRNSRAPCWRSPRTRPWSVRTTSGSTPPLPAPAVTPAIAVPAVSPARASDRLATASRQRLDRLNGNPVLRMADLISRSAQHLMIVDDLYRFLRGDPP